MRLEECTMEIVKSAFLPRGANESASMVRMGEAWMLASILAVRRPTVNLMVLYLLLCSCHSRLAFKFYLSDALNVLSLPCVKRVLSNIKTKQNDGIAHRAI